jgi:hypothetical protein
VCSSTISRSGAPTSGGGLTVPIFRFGGGRFGKSCVFASSFSANTSGNSSVLALSDDDAFENSWVLARSSSSANTSSKSRVLELSPDGALLFPFGLGGSLGGNGFAFVAYEGFFDFFFRRRLPRWTSMGGPAAAPGRGPTCWTTWTSSWASSSRASGCAGSNTERRKNTSGPAVTASEPSCRLSPSAPPSVWSRTDPRSAPSARSTRPRTAGGTDRPRPTRGPPVAGGSRRRAAVPAARARGAPRAGTRPTVARTGTEPGAVRPPAVTRSATRSASRSYRSPARPTRSSGAPSRASGARTPPPPSSSCACTARSRHIVRPLYPTPSSRRIERFALRLVAGSADGGSAEGTDG